MIPPHHVVNLSTGSTTPTTTEYASSSSATSSSSRASSPRHHHHHSIDGPSDPDGPSPRLSSEAAYSDSYDSSQEGGGTVISRRVGQQTPLSNFPSSTTTSTSLLDGGGGGGGGGYYSTGSRVSSRAPSPIPGGGLGLATTTDGYSSYTSRASGAAGGLRSNNNAARSRNVSGFSTPTTPAEEKESYDTDYYDSHHHQTSALLHKLSGTTQQTPDTSPIIGRSKQQQEQRKPGWWSRRAVESSRRKPTLSSSSFSSVTAPLLPHSSRTSSKQHHHYRDLSSTSSTTSSLLLPSNSSSSNNRFTKTLHYILSQPYVPTQPLTVLFSILLFLCFAATLTTFLLNVLSSDREPLPWRQFCQAQRPFPHLLADSLKPVNVFIGVFSVDAAVDRRNAIRLSYAKHSLPLDPLTGKPSTNVQLKFVLGRPREKWSKRVGLEMELFNDIVVLDTEENMNKGKTFEFFKWANENATVPVYYSPKNKKKREGEKRKVGVGFRKVDYVVKADDDSFIVLSELERHLRLTPRENTYWGYLIRNRFMGGEVYALSFDLVKYLATYPRPSSWSIGKEDQRVAKWMRNHPNASSIHWITERCYIYDHPKSGTTYSRGFTFPDHVEQVRLEGRRGISETERLERGGELWQSYSTVQSWKKPFSLPAKGLSVEEQVEALVEGGGRWKGQGWRSDNGRGPKSVRYDAVVFEKGDKRLLDHRTVTGGAGGGVNGGEDDMGMGMGTGVKPGVPDESETLPSARTTRFGKDLFRDPEGRVEAVHLKKKRSEEQGGIQEGPTRAPLAEDEYEIYNLVKGVPFEQDEARFHSANFIESLHHPHSTSTSTSTSSSSLNYTSPSSSSSSSPLPPLPPSIHEPGQNDKVAMNEPTGQIRLGHHAYTLPYTEERFIPYPTLRYDPSTLSIRKERMLGLPNGGTVAVHYLKRNEWFYETALALLGREKMWDHGQDQQHSDYHQVSTYSMDQFEFEQVPSILLEDTEEEDEEEMVETLPASLWGSVRMYGSPIVREDGMIVEGRRAEAHREIMGASGGGGRVGGRPPRIVGGESNEGSWAGRFGRATGGGRPGMLNLAEMEGVEIKVGEQRGGDEEEEDKERRLISVDSNEEESSNPPSSLST